MLYRESNRADRWSSKIGVSSIPQSGGSIIAPRKRKRSRNCTDCRSTSIPCHPYSTARGSVLPHRSRICNQTHRRFVLSRQSIFDRSLISFQRFSFLARFVSGCVTDCGPRGQTDGLDWQQLTTTNLLLPCTALPHPVCSPLSSTTVSWTWPTLFYIGSKTNISPRELCPPFSFSLRTCMISVSLSLSFSFHSDVVTFHRCNVFTIRFRNVCT